MAIIFSNVKLQANNHATQFFACGKVSSDHNLENYTKYLEFLENFDLDTEISVHADILSYGENRGFDASLEEVAYFTLRYRDDPNFLSRCQAIGNLDFHIFYSPQELFEQNW